MDGQLLFETERLIHRISRRDEIDALYAIMGDPDVARLVGDGNPMPIERVGRRLRSDIDTFNKFGAAHGMIVFKENMEIMGYGGLGRYEVEKPDSLELGYQFAKKYWGQGIGSEFVRAAIGYGFDKLDAALIHACVMPENKASIRVMERAGMIFQDYYPETNKNVYHIERGD